MAKKPDKKIIAFRLPDDVMKTLGSKAAKQHISRNKLVELILRSHLAKTDRELAEIVKHPVEGQVDASTLNIFA